MSHLSLRAAIILVGGLTWTAACSNLPGFAAPSGRTVDPDSVDRGDWITYRPLTRADFKAAAPPADAAQHADKLGAMTCSYLVTAPETKLEIVEERTADGSSFTANPKRLGFVAHMDRSCSWWNPNTDKAVEEYVLQHEQTHFALTELAARRLNAKVPGLRKELRFTEDTLEEARLRLSAELESVLSDAHDDLLDVNLEFDEETSAKHDPVAQQTWADEVATKLSELPARQN